MIGLAPQTLKVYPTIASLTCIEGYHLVGGTALALQINHRLSEDLDFCKWVDTSNPKNAIGYKEIQEELNQVFSGVHINAHGFNHVDFRVNDVKVTFFNEVGCNLPKYDPIDVNGIHCASVEVICAMKINTLFLRNKYRDYYDVYCLIKDELIPIETAIDLGVNYVPKLRRDAILKMLKAWQRFKDQKYSAHLSPKHNVSPKEIGEFFSKLI